MASGPLVGIRKPQCMNQVLMETSNFSFELNFRCYRCYAQEGDREWCQDRLWVFGSHST
jgi:hypothetical protein